jgi:hypothetical protein
MLDSTRPATRDLDVMRPSGRAVERRSNRLLKRLNREPDYETSSPSAVQRRDEASSLLEPPARLERATWWVEATRSIQLSYGGWTPSPAPAPAKRANPKANPLRRPTSRRDKAQGEEVRTHPPPSLGVAPVSNLAPSTGRRRRHGAYAMLVDLGGRSSAG